ncbi:MAG: TRAP transporter small permease subunit [Jannaschia helgolandensis]|jgi:TRAP-type mannitol/chloroaromatic compound transport system permease small subunit|uniref:TRAP transporter small permease protein n=1 Tax=Jannaschia helgolandensis TaxID=188906 RepID=A0A1H7Q4S1_9RHOB|nr:TRAP transporter small permease subunit [Jannaschia helgolandensis]SEL42307.1 Tripartite ATP-independent transporter, DctQ component [Jannaschia helgolandensis]|tara:strand:+ start:13 stop:909 length:897 start_codon:yes stop_codon:yes gene_type:complete
MIDAILWFFTNLGLAFYNLVYAVINPATWLDWSNSESVLRFVYYGASQELFFVLLALFLILTIATGLSRRFGWGLVRGSEFVLNWTGRIAAWAGFLMVMQQIMIVFLQRIFRVSEISIGPFGTVFTKDLSWYSEELKLYNAIIVSLCVAWTFIQGGHVRVDLVYSAVGHRTKRIIDMVGSVVFMMPALILIWLYSWFFLWRSLITPATSASDQLDRLMLKARAMRWNVETIGFSPNGFNAYFLFKILILLFVATAFFQACVFFWRSWLELREGEMSAGRYMDYDITGDEDIALASRIN